MTSHHIKTQSIKKRGLLFQFDYFTDYSLNIYLIKGEKFNYIIDTGMGSNTLAPVLRHIVHDLKEIVVVNTHYHWDHIWGNHLLKDSMIVSHKWCYEKINLEWESMLAENKSYVDGTVVKCLPNHIFDSELYFPEDHIRLFYTPGHTNDGISIYDEQDKVLIVGDNIGDTLDEPLPELECGEEVYLESVKKYLELDFDTCISGHNQVLGKDFLQRVLNKLESES